MEVTAESEVGDDNSESEDIDYHYYLPGETLDTDFIETRLLTRPETEQQLMRQANQAEKPPAELHSAPGNLQEKRDFLNALNGGGRKAFFI